MKILRTDNGYIDEKGTTIKDPVILEYVRKLAVPPSYERVEIFYNPKKEPNILYFGYDKNGKKQQIYSKKWREQADKKKFAVLIKFIEKLPKILHDMQTAIQTMLKTKTITKEGVIAVILRIIFACGFRIGQLKYQKENNTTGISTIQNRHVEFVKNEVKIEFIGKKQVLNKCIFKDSLIFEALKLLASVNSAKEAHLFSLDKPVTPVEINDWLKKYDESFTTKSIRTYMANIKLIEFLKKIKAENTNTKRKKQMNVAIEDISCGINNTKTICKKSYIDPNLVDLFIEHPRKFSELVNVDLPAAEIYLDFLRQKH